MSDIMYDVWWIGEVLIRVFLHTITQGRITAVAQETRASGPTKVKNMISHIAEKRSDTPSNMK